MRFLLAILETGAGVRFQHAVLAAEVATAEAAVAYDPLGEVAAVFEFAAGFARGSHFCCLFVGRDWLECLESVGAS